MKILMNKTATTPVSKKFGSCFFLPLLLISILFPFTAQAKVTGKCSTCHTMHNSQSGESLVYVGSVGSHVGWDGDGKMSGTPDDTGPQPNLLVSDCVGCHSSTTSATIVTIGETSIPIVFNTSSAPTTPLAGGNFYWMVNGTGDQAEKDGRGHNVFGISDIDSEITAAEGAPGSITCINLTSCHESLAYEQETSTPFRKNGCQGCHNALRHHGTDPAPNTEENAASGWYRFLDSPGGNHIGMGGKPVRGIEDDDWEYTKSNTDHNVYFGGSNDPQDPDLEDASDGQPIGDFCSGCHYDFHASGYYGDDPYTGGENYDPLNKTGSPWLMHPNNAVIPNEREFAEMFTPTPVNYNTTVPIGKSIGGFVWGTGVIESGDMVICLSCHRAHGSPYADILRWDYSSMMAHTTGDDDTNGCFFCHRNKDDL